MKVKVYTQYAQLCGDDQSAALEGFVRKHPNGNFFQSPAFFQFIEEVGDYRPLLLLALSESGAIAGSLLGVIQTSGGGLKSWLSRRLIVWGGPLVDGEGAAGPQEIAGQLLRTLKNFSANRAIYAEFRNFFDTSFIREAFEASDFEFRPHLNYLVKTDDAAAVKKRMSSSRWRQIKSSLKAGACIVEPDSEEDIRAFYDILQTLYREKVKKPLPGLDLFVKLWGSGTGKVFLVRHEGNVVGGIACPVFAGSVIYEWYVCGLDGQVKGLYPSVLATWAPIEYGLKHDFEYFDFMGAGRPDQDYGVRDFKARFGGEEVAFGRYQLVLNPSLFKVGQLGLKVYQKIK